MELVQEWDLDIICLSETSHTTKSIPALYSQSRAVGYNLAISDPVPDKFAVADPNGSYRGLSRGTAVLSRFPESAWKMRAGNCRLLPDFLVEVLFSSVRLSCDIGESGRCLSEVFSLHF